MSTDFLLTEVEQQYNQYRHLDQLRTRYVEYFTAFTAAIASASLIFSGGNFLRLSWLWPLYFLLFFIGVFSIWTSITIRMRQRATAEYIMALRDYMASKNNLKVVANVELTHSGRGFTLYESAIVLIFFLIFLDSVVLGGATFAAFYCIRPLKEMFGLNVNSSGVLSFFISVVAFVTFSLLFRRMMKKNDKHIKMVQEKYKQLGDSMKYEELRQALFDFKNQEKLF